MEERKKKKLSKGDLEKLESLYKVYSRCMYNAAYGVLHNHHDAEDVIQQSFVKLIPYASKIQDEEKGMTCNFLKIVARNTAMDYQRKRTYLNNRENYIDDIVDDSHFLMKSPDDIVVSNESAQRISNEVDKLPTIYRDIIVMERIFGISREESEEMFNASYETLKKRLTRGKEKLLEALKREGLNDGRENIRRKTR